MLNQDMIAAIAAQAEQADWDNDVKSALTRPTVSSLVELTTHPQRMEAVGMALGKYSDGRLSENLRAAVTTAHSLNAGKPEVALKFLRERRRAIRKDGPRRMEAPAGMSPEDFAKSQVHSGDTIPNTTEVTDALIGHIRSDDPARLEMAKGIAGMVAVMSLDQSNPRNIGDALARMGFEDDRPAEDEGEAA